MPSIDPQQLSAPDRHRLVISSIIPRPIAWITTLSPSGTVNLAPFSYFMGVTASPPTLAVSFGARRPIKDTLAHLRSSGEAVVHLVPESCLELANQSGAEYAAGVSEAEQLHLETIPSTRVAPPRLEVANVALECRLAREVTVGSPGATLCLLEILLAHVDDDVAADDGLPDPHRLRAVARLGERSYLEAFGWRVVDQPPAKAPPELAVRRER